MNRQTIKTIVPYLFIVPFFLFFSVFMLYPIIYSLVLSFSKWTAGKITFVGLQNYKYLLSDTLFWKSLGNTSIYLIVQVPLMLLLAAIIAVMVNANKLRFKHGFRVAFFLPALIDLVTYSIVFSILFNQSNGLVNQLLEAVGLQAVPWKTDGFYAKLLIIIAITWRWVGYNSIILLSGLQNIPDEMYESAHLDGAGPIRTFFTMTIPMLKPVLLFCVVLSTIGTFQLFAEPKILTGGGPNHQTTSVMLYLYETAFRSFNFGLASAGAYIVTSIIAIFSYLQIRLTRGGEI